MFVHRLMMTLHVNIEPVQYCCSDLSDVRYANAGQGDSAMGRVVGAEPPDRRSVSACECPSWQTGFLQALPSMADTAARRSLCLMMQDSSLLDQARTTNFPESDILVMHRT